MHVCPRRVCSLCHRAGTKPFPQDNVASAEAAAQLLKQAVQEEAGNHQLIHASLTIKQQELLVRLLT